MEWVLIGVAVTSLGLAGALGLIVHRFVRENQRRSEARVAALAAGISRDEAPEPTSIEGLFDAPGQSSGPAPQVVFAIVVAVAAGAIALGALVGGRPEPTARTTETVLAGQSPLELVALAGELDNGRLVVRGTVRGLSVPGVSAAVQLFDAQGAPIGAAHSVDLGGPRPDREASFVLIVPDAAGAGRYRISFKVGDRLLPHVDRRRAGAPTADIQT
jgi:hypothetical protein